MLVTLAWSCTSGDATDFSERSTSSELSPASGDDAGQSDALSLEGKDQVEKTSPYDASYDGSDGDTGPQGPQVGKPSTSPYYASYTPNRGGTLSIAAPEIQERKLILTDPNRISYPVQITFVETSSGEPVLNKLCLCALTTSKNRIYFQNLYAFNETIKNHLYTSEGYWIRITVFKQTALTRQTYRVRPSIIIRAFPVV